MHGIGRFSHNLIRALSQVDERNTYIIFKRSTYTDHLMERPNFSEVACKSRPVSFGTLLLMPLLAAQHNLEVLHSLFPIAPLWSAAKRVITVHDLQAVQVREFSSRRLPLLAWGAALFYHFAYRVSIPHAPRIMADSEATKRDIIATYDVPAERITVIYGGVEERFTPHQNKSTLEQMQVKYQLPPRFLLNVGNTRPHKNVKGLLRGYFHYCHIAAKPLPLALVGFRDRFFPEVEALVQDSGLSDQVMFLGYIPDDDLPLIYQMAELFITASLKEGFGLPVLESMACGTPALVSNAGSLPEIVGEGGVLIDPHNAKEIGSTLYRILEDESLLTKMRRDGLSRASFFSWEKTAKQVLSLYEQLT
jgi:glycosyltransferase involved in cell wall biosynthesis